MPSRLRLLVSHVPRMGAGLLLSPFEPTPPPSSAHIFTLTTRCAGSRVDLHRQKVQPFPSRHESCLSSVPEPYAQPSGQQQADGSQRVVGTGSQQPGTVDEELRELRAFRRYLLGIARHHQSGERYHLQWVAVAQAHYQAASAMPPSRQSRAALHCHMGSIRFHSDGAAFHYHWATTVTHQRESLLPLCRQLRAMASSQ